MQPVLLATRNANKTREFRELLGKDFDVHDLSFFDEMTIPKESGRTFEENAILKAVAASQHRRVQDRHLLVVADDSGLEVAALGGAPGILNTPVTKRISINSLASLRGQMCRSISDRRAFVA